MGYNGREEVKRVEMHERGVLAGSEIFFHTPTLPARERFLTLVCTGHFTCDGNYRVERNTYGSGLVMQVQRGSGYVHAGDTHLELVSGDVVLLDSFLPHAYGTEKGWEILWLHFAGRDARDWIELCAKGAKKCPAGKDAFDAGQLLHSVYGMCAEAKTPPDDVRLHAALTSLVSLFAHREEDSGAMETASRMLSGNLSEEILTRDIARAVHLSESQLNRLFRAHTGLTPHQYRIEARLGYASYLLAATEKSGSEIAQMCGFHDASAFVRAFRSHLGTTPGEYRSGKKDKTKEGNKR